MLPARWARIPRTGPLCYSWLFFRSCIWPQNFQGRTTISASKERGCGDNQNTNKTQTKQMDPSESLDVGAMQGCRGGFTAGLCNLASLDGDPDSAVAPEFRVYLSETSLFMKAGEKVYPETFSAI